MPPKIIVLTPVKNEAWILHRFLSVCSQFADHIIVADQNSTDGSLDIYPLYPKVILIKNEDEFYGEDSRQLLLIKKAREIEQGDRILLALDADEILAANAIHTNGWKSMLKAEKGTSIYIEKPDLVTPYECVRFKDSFFPIGFVDDNSSHNPTFIHSKRIPTKENAPKLYLHDVKVLHYAYTRSNAQQAKLRLYAMIECINNSNPIHRRRAFYAHNNAFLKSFTFSACEKDWLTGWEELGIDMTTILQSDYFWHDIEALKYFGLYGEKKFWKDDIWYVNWENIRQYAIKEGHKGIPEKTINAPGKIFNMAVLLMDRVLTILKKILH